MNEIENHFVFTNAFVSSASEVEDIPLNQIKGQKGREKENTKSKSKGKSNNPPGKGNTNSKNPGDTIKTRNISSPISNSGS